jgi:hypothetical protein
VTVYGSFLFPCPVHRDRTHPQIHNRSRHAYWPPSLPLAPARPAPVE